MIQYTEILPDSLEKLNDANLDIQRLRRILEVENELKKVVLSSVRDDEKKSLLPHLEILGAGSESVVIVDPEDNEKVISIGYGPTYTSGVVPFTEIRNYHNIVEALFPEHFPKLFKITGSTIRRDTSRQRIRGKESSTTDNADVHKKVSEGLERMGITDFWMDDTVSNSLMDEKSDSIKYIDMISGHGSGLRDVDISKIKTFLQNKFRIADSEIDNNDKWKTILRSIRLLKELDIVNQIFYSMCYRFPDPHMYDISDYQPNIDAFYFTGNEEDIKSKERIKTWLNLAIEAVIKNGHIFKNGEWIK